MVTALTSSFLALIVGFEGLNANAAAVDTIYARVKANQLHNIIEDIPFGLTQNAFSTNGMNHPNRADLYPYAVSDTKSEANQVDGATATGTSKCPDNCCHNAGRDMVC